MKASHLAAMVTAHAGPLSFAHMQAVMYLAVLETWRDTGRLPINDPFVAEWYGPRCLSITPAWYANHLGNMASRALRQQARRWLLQESTRRGAHERIEKLNMPGGWSLVDAHAQSAGMLDAMAVGPAWLVAWALTGATVPAGEAFRGRPPNRRQRRLEALRRRLARIAERLATDARYREAFNAARIDAAGVHLPPPPAPPTGTPLERARQYIEREIPGFCAAWDARDAG